MRSFNGYIDVQAVKKLLNFLKYNSASKMYVNLNIPSLSELYLVKLHLAMRPELLNLPTYW